MVPVSKHPWLLWLVLTISLFRPAAASTNAIVVDANTGIINLAPKVIYVADPNDTLRWPEIQFDSSIEWRNSEAEVINQGFVNASYWYRWEFDSRIEAERLLSITYPPLDDIQIFLVSTDSTLRFQLGDSLPHRARPIAHRNFVIPMQFKANMRYTLYLRLQTSSSHQLPIELLSKEAFLAADQARVMFDGAYLGIMIVMIIYNLFLYFSIRDINYVVYVITIGTLGFFHMCLLGFGYQYGWPNSISFNQLILPLAAAVSTAAMAYFSILFLELKKQDRRLYYVVLAIFIALCSVAVLSPIIPTVEAIKITIVLAAILAVVSFYASVSIWRSGFKPAGFFALAYLSLFSATIIMVLNKYGFLPRTFLTENGQRIGSLAEVVLFSLALAYRVKVLREEKENARREVQEGLEREVALRTQELTQTMEKLAEMNVQLELQNRQDGLTRTFNRRCFDDTLVREWRSSPRKPKEMSLIMLDIDHFKTFNDKYGHLIGDDCLRIVGTCIKSCIHRSADGAYRYGGEEFCILLPHTPKKGALKVAHRIQEQLQRVKIPIADNFIHITVSMGVATLIPANDLPPENLISMADKALYQAKAQGRDQICFAEPDTAMQSSATEPEA